MGHLQDGRVPGDRVSLLHFLGLSASGKAPGWAESLELKGAPHSETSHEMLWVPGSFGPKLVA